MGIVAISRDWGANPSIVRIVIETDDLAAITTVGYLAAQEDNIKAINAGPFEWQVSDLILAYYATDELDFFRRDAATDSLVVETAPGSLSNVLADGRIFVGSAANVATPRLMSGDVTISNTGVSSISAGVIVNAMVDAGAGIEFSKLEALPSAEILVGSAGNVATAVAVTGDVTISNAGVTAIAAGVIVNADINAAAAIAFSKLAALPSAQLLVGSAGNVATAVAITGDVTISNTGVTTIAAGAIDLAMLSTGIAPSHVVKFADQETTVGGAAAEAFAVAGVLVTDLAFVQIVDNGTGNVTALQAVCTADTLTVTFSGNPGNDCVFNYQILRAAV